MHLLLLYNSKVRARLGAHDSDGLVCANVAGSIALALANRVNRRLIDRSGVIGKTQFVCHAVMSLIVLWTKQHCLLLIAQAIRTCRRGMTKRLAAVRTEPIGAARTVERRSDASVVRRKRFLSGALRRAIGIVVL